MIISFLRRHPLLSRSLSWIYRAAYKYNFRRQLRQQIRLSVPVICIGNLEAGGTGKTPLTLALAREFTAMGCKIGILSRGYGRKCSWLPQKQPSSVILVNPQRHTAAEVGDEPLLLSRVAPTYVASDRRIAAQQALADGCDLLLLDDGHQNQTIYKNYTIIVSHLAHLDDNPSTIPILPAGRLREDWFSGISRADALALVSHDSSLLTHHDPSHYLPADWSGKIIKIKVEASNPHRYRGCKFIALSGIGKPEKFFAMLESCGCQILAKHTFPDHHNYTATELHQIYTTADHLRAKVITTSKDYVKIPTAHHPQTEVLEIRYNFDSSSLIAAIDAAVRANTAADAVKNRLEANE